MLQGLYTETNNVYGNFSSDKYYFIPDLFIKYDLKTDSEIFEITHKCAFINTTKNQIDSNSRKFAINKKYMNMKVR